MLFVIYQLSFLSLENDSCINGNIQVENWLSFLNESYDFKVDKQSPETNPVDHHDCPYTFWKPCTMLYACKNACSLPKILVQ
jgi:hypothetical protein